MYGYYYPDGIRWRTRKPHYSVVGLTRGPLAANTVIKPRVAPPLFGVGLLEGVPEADIAQRAGSSSGEPAWRIRQGIRRIGRFGWQGDALSIRDQTTKALAAEMGLTSPESPSDDCTPLETDCLQQPGSASPEVVDELIEALVSFERTLAPPAPASNVSGNGSLGAELFVEVGCAACHRLQITTKTQQSDGTTARSTIAPYTDLRLHDLGRDMADETVSGARVQSQWRTAPLWGLSYRLHVENNSTLLHDGRARSVEEAILWHGGEAASARQSFVNLGPRSRGALLGWVESR
jgi:CxxC motif-containing protein (DUF1111 family)